MRSDSQRGDRQVVLYALCHCKKNEYAVIATTRPETIFGDTAVCINFNNPKTAHLKGKLIVPIANRKYQ